MITYLYSYVCIYLLVYLFIENDLFEARGKYLDKKIIFGWLILTLQSYLEFLWK